MARIQLNLTMTKEEWTALRTYSSPGKRNEFIRQAIKRQIEEIEEEIMAIKAAIKRKVRPAKKETK